MRLSSCSGPTKMIISLEWFGPCREKKEEDPPSIISMVESFCSKKTHHILQEKLYTKDAFKKRGSIWTSLLLCIC